MTPRALPRHEARPELREALQVIGQRKWWIFGTSLLLVGLAIFMSIQQTPIYNSDAAVLVTPLDPAASIPGAFELNVATEVEVASSYAVAEVVAQELGLTEVAPSTLLNGLSVDNPVETEIIEFNYDHPDPVEAQRRAQGFAEGYLQYRRLTINEQIAGSAEALEAELETLNGRLDRVQSQLSRLDTDDPGVFTLESEAQLLQGLILDRQLNRLALREDLTVGRVVQPADLPIDPASPNHVTNAAFGLAAGLALGIGLAFLSDRLSGRVRSDQEVEQKAGAPILGGIPRVPAWRKRKQAYLVTRSEWGSPTSESYRILRTNLLSTAALYDARSILVTSANIGEGKTATAANLAVALAKAGQRTILVSADLRRPRLHEFLPSPRKVGLTEVLTGGASVDQALVRSQSVPGDQGWENLSLLMSGTSVQDTSEILSSSAMQALLNNLKERADYVIVDAPPILPVTDAMILAKLVDGVLFVIGPRGLSEITIASARQQLDKVGATVLGVVLNGTDFGFHESYYSY